MNYAFHPGAMAELLDAIDYYENCEPGLAADFAMEMHSAIESIQSFPNAWLVLEDNIRRFQHPCGQWPHTVYVRRYTLQNCIAKNRRASIVDMRWAIINSLGKWTNDDF